MRISDWSSDVCSSDLLKLEIVHEVVPAAELMDRARAWLATNPDPVKPWDVKGAMPPQKRGMTVPEDSAAYMMGAGVIAGKAGYNLPAPLRSEEPTSELQSLMRLSYAVFCFTKKTTNT